ncbi:dUTP diphosphatase [Marinagarivorans algicola]|uniref:dUTP diphosphatase n=1 Tax=Marinagarivorans algicola TaxID=1513270 RepID=UPI0006B9F26B|nr:dUTP diphosphatase [Marinagarivorans algicola]
MQQQLLKMLEMQDAMNARVTAQWRDEGYPWYRAIWVECAEMLDHYGWKWWKKQSPDMEQVILELVDIWHFGLSDLLQNNKEAHAIAQTLSQSIAAHASAAGDFKTALEAFVAKVLSDKTFDVEGFCRVMAVAGLSFEQLYVQYVGKNVLNFFRQDHGYKDGTYRKRWLGREDNEHLVEVLLELNASSDTFQTDVYEALKVRYLQG